MRHTSMVRTIKLYTRRKRSLPKTPHLLTRGVFVLLLAVSTVVVGPLRQDTAAYQPDDNNTINILTIGDSYSAGNGAVTEDAGYVGANPCHRSELTYSEQYASALRGQGYEVQLKNRACMGWVTSQVQDLIAQPGILNADLDMIFMTIGGNNAKFSSVAAKCMVNTNAELSSACLSQLVWSYEQLGSVESSTKNILSTLRSNAPNAQIVLLGYPNLIGDCNYEKLITDINGTDGPNFRELHSHFPHVTASNGMNLQQLGAEADAHRNVIVPVGNILRAMQDDFTNSQRAWVESMGEQVHYVSMNGNSGFDGRELMCNNGTEYLNNISLLSPTEAAGWVHPNSDGHGVYRDSILWLGPENWVVPRAASVSGIHYNSIVLDPLDDQRRSYFYDDQGMVHHIKTEAIFQCIKSINFEEYHVAQSSIDEQPQGTDIDCFHDGHTPLNDLYYDGVPRILRAIEDTRARVYINGLTYPIADSSTFNCLGGWNNTTIIELYEYPAGSSSNSDAHCFEGDKAITSIDGAQWLLDKTTMRYSKKHIETQAEYNCLVESGIPTVSVADNQKNFYHESFANEINCYNNDYYGGKIVDFGDSKKYFIASGEGGRTHHYIPDAETYNCLVGRGHQDIGTVEQAYIDKYTDREDYAVCFDNSYWGGKIVDFGTSAKYFITANGLSRSYHHIPDTETYNCLVGRGHQDLSTQNKHYIKRYANLSSDASCVDRDYWRTNIITIEGDSYYVHADDSYQWIKWQGDYSCFQGIGSAVRQNVSRDYVDEHFNFVGGNASCYDSGHYNDKVVTIAGSPASYFVINGTLQHIGSTTDYYCLLERAGVSVRSNVELGYLQDNLTLKPGNVGCHTKAEIKHDVVYSGGRYWFTHNNGKRYLMKNSNHEYCMRVRYGYVGKINDADLKKYTYSSTKATCYEINKYAGKIIRNTSNGAIYYVEGSGTKRWINTWDRYLCQSRKVGGYINVSSTTASRIREGSNFKHCINGGVRNRIIREANGTAYWIDGAGRRFWIPDGHTWNCFGGWGRVALDRITPETRNHYRYYGHARCYGGTLLNNRVIRHSSGDAHYVSWSGTRYWLSSGSSYWHYRHVTGQYHVNVARWLINSIPYGGAR